jgi:hypothetical protein
VFNEYSSFNSLFTFVQVIHVFICACVHLFCLFTVKFICVINLLITCMSVPTLLINVVVFVHVHSTAGNFGHEHRGLEL